MSKRKLSAAAAAISALLVVVSGCGSLVGVDGDYQLGQSSSSGANGVPGAWTCGASSYNSAVKDADDATCDCECGAPDPDCDSSLGATIFDCAGTSCVEDTTKCGQCSDSGHCIAASE